MPLGYEYKRYFIILQEEDKGYEMTAGKIPTGYVKIEIKKDKARISGFIQNMKSDANSKYRLNLLAPKEKLILDIGLFRMDNNGRGEFYAEFDSDNVNGSNISISEFTGALVMAGSGVPLAGYEGRETIPWREWIKDERTEQYETAENETRVEEDVKESIAEVEETRHDESIEEKESMETREKEANVRLMPEDEEQMEVLPVDEMTVREEKEDARQSEEVMKTVTEREFKDVENMEMRAEPAPLYFEEPEAAERYSFHETDFTDLIKEVEMPESRHKKEKESESKLQKKLLDAVKNMEKYEGLYTSHPITWYRIGNKLHLLNDIMIPINGARMPLSCPYIAENAGRNIGKSLLGLEYRDREIRYVYIGIPGIYYPACRICYEYKGFSAFKKIKNEVNRGYWIMCIDIKKGKICRL